MYQHFRYHFVQNFLSCILVFMFVIANIMLQMAIQYGIIHLLVICILEDTPLNGGRTMHITYKRLWKLLIDREMNRQDLIKLCNLSSASVAKLGKCENITTDPFSGWPVRSLCRTRISRMRRGGSRARCTGSRILSAGGVICAR